MYRQVAISLVVLAYNEAATIRRAILPILDSGFDVELVVVDDVPPTPREDSRRVLRCSPQESFPREESAQRSGASLGFTQATRDGVFVQDADLEYDPADFAQVHTTADGRAC